MPPTVAGPKRILLCARAKAMSFLVSASGTPSAMTAHTRMVGCCSATMVDSKALQAQHAPFGLVQQAGKLVVVNGLQQFADEPAVCGQWLLKRQPRWNKGSADLRQNPRG